MDVKTGDEGAGMPLDEQVAAGQAFPEGRGLATAMGPSRPEGGTPTIPRRRRADSLSGAEHSAPTYDAASRPAPARRRKSWRRRLIVLAVVFSIVLAVAIPGVVAAVSGLRDYDEIKAIGLSGVHHLLTAKDILEGVPTSGTASSSCAISTPSGTATPGSSSSGFSVSSLLSGSIPDATTVKKAQAELTAAEGDFAQLQGRLNRPDWILNIAGDVPKVSGEMMTARGLATAGYDVSAMGVELSNAALPLLTRLHGASLGGQSLLTQADVTSLQKAMDDSVKLLADIQVQVASINVADLPICASQKTEFTQLVGELPKAQSDLQQADSLIQPIGWLAGVDGPRHFLVEELDSTELRSSGGFSGQYSILNVQDGKIGSLPILSMDDLDYRCTCANPPGYSNGWIFGDNGNGRHAPAPYSWWPITNWGLRDANLAADFPTDAQLLMSVFKSEATNPFFKSLGGGNTDGVIQFTSTAMGDLLKVTGPLTVPLFNETVTADNLVDKIHFYQLTQAGAAVDQSICLQQGGSTTDCEPSGNNARHYFVRTMATALEARLRGLTLKQLVPVAKQVFIDMQAHNIQFYVTNKALENLLLQHSAGGAIGFPVGTDGFMVDSTNWSAGKVDAHINSLEEDNVTLDDKGGATHDVTITFDNYDANIVPGDFVSYWDYVRIYAPKGAQLKSAYGFQSTTQQCTSSTCNGNPYPGNLVCTGGRYTPGPRTGTLLPGNDRDPPLMTLGGPTATTSDVANLAMWAGNVVVPLGCTATLTLSWYVPGVAPASTANVAASVVPYTDLIRRQGGTDYEAKVTLHPAQHVSAEGKKTVTYDTPLSTDLRFTFGAAPQPPSP